MWHIAGHNNITIKYLYKKYKVRAMIVLALVLCFAYLFCLPKNLFPDVKFSTVVTDRNGELLGARIADDGQWRFPPTDSVPYKYEKCLITFEDKYFRYHPGFNPVSIVRAALGNARAGRIKSGGSTISMQVIRLSRQKERTVYQKLIETILATRLEMRYSKDEILSLYASFAPFGGNVVGIDAASWRYFSKPASELTWGESATLAILPNSPSLIHLGRNRGVLKEKRDRLLQKLLKENEIDSTEYYLAIEEPIPSEPSPLPNNAFHLTEYYAAKQNGKKIKTSIDIHLQKSVENIVNEWNNELRTIGVNDLAAIVFDVRTGEPVAYCGNANPDIQRQGAKVDILRSPRSTGSILKPFLYCACLQEGLIMPHSLIQDTPININGFSPQNFDLQFNGAVPADEALYRSLNVPYVHLLRKYGVPRFYNLLKDLGISTLTRSADNYGLSLILGGAEGKLYDIAKMYCSLSRTYQGLDKSPDGLYDKIAIHHTLETLKEVNRPDEIDWKIINSVKKVAWKTGTSFGFRDAWAVGITPDYVVGVWAGNADGEGVPQLMGGTVAGPVMFRIFNVLPKGKDWFDYPESKDMLSVETCRQSGYIKGPYCTESDTVRVSRKYVRSETCPYHKSKGNFMLPPAMEWFYKQRHPDYQPNTQDTHDAPMGFIYPENGSRIKIPKQLDGSNRGITLNLAHRKPEAKVFWHIDEHYLGETKFIHQFTILPEKGHHSITAVDDEGNSVSVGFTIE